MELDHYKWIWKKWIWKEIRASRAFTALNIIGIWMNIWVVLVFLALATGIEHTTITKITENVDLFTLEIHQKTPTEPLHFSDLAVYERDPRVRQVVPVVTKFVELKPQDSSEGNPLLVYIESHFAGDRLRRDLRTESLRYVYGGNPTADATNGIVMSESTLKRLETMYPSLSRRSLETQSFSLVAQRYGTNNTKETRPFPGRIVGVAKTTPYNDAVVYVSWPLAVTIDEWSQFRSDSTKPYRNRGYERIDLVTGSLADLESVRKEVQERGYPSKSIVDRIDDVRNLLWMVRVVFLTIIAIAAMTAVFNIGITLSSYVMKRRHDIGILKALGATNGQIQRMFILHGCLMVAASSAFGAVTAYGLIALFRAIVQNIQELKGIELFRLEAGFVVLTVLVALVLGVIAAFIPARQAALIEPVETMREN